jgi:hypothetical protein
MFGPGTTDWRHLPGVFPGSVEAISWALNLPAVRTLIRYTCLSERIVQTALDREVAS